MNNQVNLTQCFDAQIWVQEWMKTIKNHPDIPTDPNTMLGWFANALMAGYDEACRRYKVPGTLGRPLNPPKELIIG